MKKLAVLALGLFIAACSETPTETPTMDAPPLAMSIADAPAESGIVMRDGQEIGLTWYDFKADLRVTIGAGDFFCSGFTGFDIVATQDVAVTEEIVVRLQQGTVRAAVQQGPFVNSCPAIATGVVDFLLTDNHVFAPAEEDRKRTNAFGWGVMGTLTSPGGETADLNAIRRVTFFPDGHVESTNVTRLAWN